MSIPSAFAFSPDFQHVAVVGLDGRLRIIDYIDEKYVWMGMAAGFLNVNTFLIFYRIDLRLLDTHQSYYGGLTCVAWSPDGRYILVSSAAQSLSQFRTFGQSCKLISTYHC